MDRSKYFTKSTFKEGLDCITKLYYTNNNEYNNSANDDSFLEELANGGFQIGELAKYLFVNNPDNENITIKNLTNEEAVIETSERLKNDCVVAEAAFLIDKFYIRADIIKKEGKTLKLYEVKAKSIDGIREDSNSFISYKGKANECVKSEWSPYLYDIAFQKYVIEKAYPDYKVEANIILADKSKKVTINNLNQYFQINKNGYMVDIITPKNVSANDLGVIPLAIINVDEIVNDIQNKYKVPKHNMDFIDFINYAKDIYLNRKKIYTPVSTKCKSCTYNNKNSDLKSGFYECWKNHTNYSDELLKKPLAIELWNGRVDKMLSKGQFLLESINEEDVKSSKPEPEKNGLTNFQRKWLQITKAKNNDNSYYFDSEGFLSEVNKWNYPLHLIDFETSTVALPFHKGTSPYQGIAFQFSHHVLYEDGKIEHKDQYIHFEKGVYPNLDFIRTLKKSLSTDNGTIFRYHNHENNYLRMIYDQIVDSEIGEIEQNEKTELLNFIDNITKYKITPKDKDYTYGNRCMVDLYEIVKDFYYSPSTNGKISIKNILPAILNDCEELRNKYSKGGLYGKELEIKSLNFDDHVWLQEEFNNNPYKTLPVISDINLDDNIEEDDEFNSIADGGAALVAYNYLQYSHINEEKRVAMRNGLFRYCELDTMAMVMILEAMLLWSGKNQKC